MKILISTCVRQSEKIFKEYLESLNNLSIPDGFSVDKYFVFHNCIDSLKHLLTEDIKYDIYEDESQCNNTEYTHSWGKDNFNAVINMKNSIIDYSLENGYDYLFLVDSDLVLHPFTLMQLYYQDKDIIAEIFWTQWIKGGEFGSNCWDMDSGDIYGSSAKWLKKGVYKVGGTGACTLIKRTVLKKGVNFSPVYNVSFATWNDKGVLWEDRCFQVRASANDFELYIDTHYPAYHLYREREYNQFMEEKENGFLFKNDYEVQNEIIMRTKTDKRYTFSIIVPFHDEFDYIEDCIKSIKSQFYTGGYELILVVNKNLSEAKIEGLRGILEANISDYKLIIAFEKETPGYARNTGIELASNDYVIFLDADDSLLPNALEVINNEINNEEDIIHFNFVMHNEPDGFEYDSDVNESTTDKWHICWNKVWNRDFINSKIRFDEDMDMSEDLDFYQKAVELNPSQKFSNGFIIKHLKNRKGSLQYIERERRRNCSLDIIIPSYNSQNTLHKLLDGISAQTELNNVNVTIVDDCSSNVMIGYYEKIYNVYSEHFNIQIIKTDINGGAGVARQVGLDNTNSEYVLFFDSDDAIINNNMVASIRGYIRDYYSDIIWNKLEKTAMNGVIYIDEQRQTAHLQDKVYKRSYLEDCNIRFHEWLRFSEDAYFNYIALYCTKNIIYTELLYYRCLINQESYTLKNFEEVVVDKLDETLIAMLQASELLKGRNGQMAMYLKSYALYWLHQIWSCCVWNQKPIDIDNIVYNVVVCNNEIFDECTLLELCGNDMFMQNKELIAKDVKARIGLDYLEQISFLKFVKNILTK